MDLDPREVVECGKVGPGEVLVVDTRRGEVIRNLDAKREVAGRRPYARWVARYMATLVPDPARVPPVHAGEALTRAAAQLRLRLRGSAAGARADGRHRRRPGVEHGRRHADSAALGGAAEPLRLLPAALRPGDQPADRFAARGDGDVAPHAPRAGAARRCSSGPATRGCSGWSTRCCCPRRWPRSGTSAGFSTVTLDAVWDTSRGVDGLRPALTALRRAAERAARRGAHILIISDRAAGDATHAPIPMLLAIGAVRQHLVHTGLRARVGLVAEAGDAFDIHHFATLIGYGAEAVHPWLALETHGRRCSARRASHRGASARPRRRRARRRPRRARSSARRPRRGCSRSCRRWASPPCRSYCGAQIFEVLGLGHEVIEHLLRGHRVAASAASASRRSRRTCWRATARPIRRTGSRPASLPDHGRVRFRKEGEDHGWAPPVVVALQQAVKANGTDGATAASWSRTAAGGRPARATCWPCARARRFRSRRSSRRSRSAPGSSRRRCRSARSRRRRTPRSPSR